MTNNRQMNHHEEESPGRRRTTRFNRMSLVIQTVLSSITFHLRRFDDAWARQADRRIAKFKAYISETPLEQRQRMRACWIRRKLMFAREAWRQVPNNELPASFWSEQEKHEIRRILRQYEVRYAVTSSRTQKIAAKIVEGIATLALVLGPVPAASLAYSQYGETGWTDALASWAVFMTLVALLGAMAGWFSPYFASRAGFVAAAIFGNVSFLVVMQEGVEFNKVAIIAVIATIMLFLGFFMTILVDDLLRAYFFYPIRARLVALMPTTSVIATELFKLYLLFWSSQGSSVQNVTRLDLMRSISVRQKGFLLMANMIYVPKALRGIGNQSARIRYLKAAAYLDQIAEDLLQSRNRDDFDGIVRNLKAQLFELVDGDCSNLPEPLQVSTASRIKHIARSMVTPLLLAATALAIPYIPFVNPGDVTVTTIQIGLFVSALLTWIPADVDAKNQVSSLFGPPRT